MSREEYKSLLELKSKLKSKPVAWVDKSRFFFEILLLNLIGFVEFGLKYKTK